MKVRIFKNGNIEIITKTHKDGTYEGIAIYLKEGKPEGYVTTYGSFKNTEPYIERELIKLWVK